MTPLTEFLITSSTDGTVKFWKKIGKGIEFVKQFKAHQGEILSVSVSADGRSFASCGADETVKIFDVITFDLLTMIPLGYLPRSICWVHQRGEKNEPIHAIKGLHRTPVSVMVFNEAFDCVVSADEGGMVEYWQPSGNYEKPSGVFAYKSSTNLFDFKKAKSSVVSLTVSPNGKQLAAFSLPDRKIRLFDFATAKLHRTYDESLQMIEDMHQTGSGIHKLDNVEFGRRFALEREVESPAFRNKPNIIFDESGHFILYGSIHGIKVVNTYTNQVVKNFGKDENFRPLHLALYQGQPQKKKVASIEMGASSNPLLQEQEARDPILTATGIGKVRFYMFTNDEEVSKSTRDKTLTGTGAIIHTSYGDIQIRLFPKEAPKAVENFVGLSKSGYYNNTIFHRVIRKFMIQCGDPLGDGTGGDSIWGHPFEDEFSALKHDKPYTVSMANAGPGTNGSQFFITTEKTPWLDGKHTIFGRATQGFDVIHKIENTRTFKEKPESDIKILNIDIT
ncbi:unnamed protein product [Parascedosporium putredinis]|uniref:Peptidyl-prolyl cis-trans isomerase-like 1 n=1 Tax=Parascedosporium putredinis TaxID=1442378 RepID=A0A9P1H746_9PEZI|nr:unnamed protein product [Parascedosporium putredinis]CAI7998115.1 unnamed protein product [Parascedosporium putredinis]